MNTSLPDGPESLCTNAAMRRATRRLGQLYDDAVEPIGLKATQLGLLSSIERMNGPTMRVLADHLVMDLSALGHTLKPLMRDGYVALTPHEKDKRAKIVSLTDAGKAKLDEGAALWQVAHTRFEELFGEENARELRRMLDWVASPGFEAKFNKD
jgi:DNA-binding MarR family transcriptional regulator